MQTEALSRDHEFCGEDIHKVSGRTREGSVWFSREEVNAEGGQGIQAMPALCTGAGSFC
jgi:hypothetical protein